MKQASSVRHFGTLLRIPAVAGLVVFGLSLCSDLIMAQPAAAQLPPVNMGKFVHQPGDNQYSSDTQGQRHGGGGYQVINPSPQQIAGPSGWVPTHKNKPDISLEPIVCDEPIAKAGFPPIPDSLELPGIRGGGSFSPSYGGGGGGSSYGGGGGGGTAPGMGAAPPSRHQGYDNYAPGAFNKGSTTGKGAQMYVKPSAPSEQYSSGDGAVRPSQAQHQLSSLGKEPVLDGKATTTAAPEAPQAVSVGQSTTQDLSLPDDQNQNGGKKKQNQAGKGLQRMQRRLGQKLMQPLYNMPIRMPAMH